MCQIFEVYSNEYTSKNFKYTTIRIFLAYLIILWKTTIVKINLVGCDCWFIMRLLAMPFVVKIPLSPLTAKGEEIGHIRMKCF